MDKDKKVSANALGTGMAAKAASLLAGRRKQLEDQENAILGGSPGQADRAPYNWDKSGTDKKSGRYN